MNTIYQLYDSEHPMVEATFIREIERLGLKAVLHRKWESDTEALPVGIARFVVVDGQTTATLADLDDTLTYVERRRDGHVKAVVAAGTMAAATEAMALIEGGLPARVHEDDGTIPARFWYLGSHGPVSVTRRIAAPEFAAIRGNYTAPVADGLARLIGPDFEAGHGGQLILWHGQPGTDKTWALRALTREWSSWCQIDYVVDPEAFFGKASYLMSVLMGEEEFASDEEASKPVRWRLLILEDTGELLSSDARERAGQGLSRLLNTVDGFLGQGLRTLILITTNEEVGRLHPAVARPGRCAATIPFAPLNAAEAARWAETHGVVVPRRAQTIAQLFARRDGTLALDEERGIGFGDAAA